jgi:hypothetical protein
MAKAAGRTRRAILAWNSTAAAGATASSSDQIIRPGGYIENVEGVTPGTTSSPTNVYAVIVIVAGTAVTASAAPHYNHDPRHVRRNGENRVCHIVKQLDVWNKR